MPKFLGLEAQVIVDGNALEEFGIEQSAEENRVTCYIPSEVGQQFSLTFGNSGNTQFSAATYMDGILAGGVLVGPGSSATYKGAYINEKSFHPFSFTKLELTDDDNTLAETRKIMHDLGVIEVRFCRVKRGEAKPASDVNRNLALQPVHERSKKAGCHRVFLGSATECTAVTFYHTQYIDSVDKPYARFIFRYRPLDLLQAHGIAPLPREPSREQSTAPGTSTDQRTTGKRPSEGDTSVSGKKRRGDKSEIHLKGEQGEGPSRKGQLAEMKKQLEQLQARIMAQETEANDSDDDIKREPSPICVPPAPKGERVIIDLTI